MAKLLESRLRPPHELVIGYAPSSLGGLPRLRESRLRGEYPFVRIAFDDDELPVSVDLEAFTPLVPMDAAESGLPAAVLRYRVSNRSDSPVEVSVVGSLFNAVGFVQPSSDELVSIPALVGEPRNAFRDDGRVRGLYFSSSLPDDDLRHGTMALMTSASRVTVRPDWPASWPGHGLDDLWADLCEDGRLEATADAGAEWLEARVVEMEEAAADDAFLSEARLAVRNAKKARAGSLAISDLLTPGDEQRFEFVLAWHFPNRRKAWHRRQTSGDQGETIVRNFYATRFGDAWEVGRYLHENATSLERKTRAFHASFCKSSLPLEVVDAVASNVAALRSTTCFRLEDGTFAGWEGSLSSAGSCFGNCTHVWNYARQLPFFFRNWSDRCGASSSGLKSNRMGR